MKKYSEFVNELTEKFSDLEYLIDQLSNSMEHYDEKGFVDHMSSETNISSDVLKKIYQDYQKLSTQVKNQNVYGWEQWLKTYSGIGK